MTFLCGCEIFKQTWSNEALKNGNQYRPAGEIFLAIIELSVLS